MKRIALLILWTGLFAGCRPEKPIEVSEEHKPNDIMMVGITVRGGTTWTIKLVNDRKKVLNAENSVYEFAKSFDFSEDPSNPKWVVPQSWKKLDLEKPFRKATFEIQDDEKEANRSQVIVSELAMGQQSTSPEQSIAENINRWRKQMNVDPVINYSVKPDGEQVEFPASDLIVPFMKPILVDGQTMYFEKIEGTKPKSASSAPFMNGMGGMGMHGDISKMMSKSKPDQPSNKPELPFDYTKPESWKQIAGGSVSLLKFNVGNDDPPTQVSISTFSAAAVNWESTVTMWQGQLKVPQTKGDDLAKITETIANDSLTGQLVLIKGDAEKKGQSLLGVMIEHETGKWFVKLQGSEKTVETERVHFESFVKSIQFRTNENNNGKK